MTVTGDEEQGTLLPAAKTEHLPQINVITTHYSHTSSSVTSEISERRETLETGLNGLGSVGREESEPQQQRAAGMQYDYQLYPLNPTSSRTSVTTDVRSNTTTTSEVDFRMLGTIDASTGSPDLGWDTDQFPMDATFITKVGVSYRADFFFLKPCLHESTNPGSTHFWSLTEFVFLKLP